MEEEIEAVVGLGPRGFGPHVSKDVRFAIAKSSALGPYRDACLLLAQNQVQLLWDFFEEIYGQGCWQDKDFMEDVLKHHPELRIRVKRGIRGQEYLRPG